MSAQYLVSLNGTDTLEILSEEGIAGSSSAAATSEGVSQTKQKEALYYIVAVITFYALTFMLLFCKYARFRRKAGQDDVPYFAMPPDFKMASHGSGNGAADRHVALALNKYGPARDSYGSYGVTPKVMRVKVLSHWWCRRREETSACDV